ncbi:flagellar motor switch protein FliN [Novosphingobium sp. PC22D]|uniref:flagellar motor switch protein FliN n=1 Tax=Novosphingobium sp. PC22D TaxID=1962403 RepID=UPI000BEF53BC|nr:flagellar motor switch protein FliN [Novosphingobium sp. PC22D]PEQ14298.1 flagellar motor switch protein FliN [Novosphingobium sp. PC22D]
MSLHPRGFEFLRDIEVRLSVELGRTDMRLKDVLSLGEDSIIVLDKLTDELLDVLVNGKVVARGEVVAQNGRFGLRIVEMLDPGEERASTAAAPLAAPEPEATPEVEAEIDEIAAILDAANKA